MIGLRVMLQLLAVLYILHPLQHAQCLQGGNKTQVYSKTQSVGQSNE